MYASSWIKYHEPAAFCAALLNAQPMGFWSPHTLVRDARRHGVVVRTPDLNASLATATLEPTSEMPNCSHQRPRGGHLGRQLRGMTSVEPQPAVRLGIGSVRGLSSKLAEVIETERGRPAPTATSRTSCGGCRR